MEEKQADLTGKNSGFELSQKRLSTSVRLAAGTKQQGNEKEVATDEIAKDFNGKPRRKRQKKARLSQQKVFQCEFCDKSFVNSSSLRSHLKSHSDERPYKCDLCGKAFKWSSHLTCHKVTHEDRRRSKYKCQICNKSFLRPTSLVAHAKIHTRVKHKCNLCFRSFNGLSSLWKHRYKYHLPKNNGFKDSEVPAANTCNPTPYMCHLCGETFQNVAQLTSHKGVHTGATRYECQFCDKSLTSLPGLKSHMKAHTSTREYKCAICERTFTKFSDLSSHANCKRKKKVSSYMRVKPSFKCDVCSKWVKDLTKHCETHASGTKLYQCSICKEIFDESKLLSHQQKHEGSPEVWSAHWVKSPLPHGNSSNFLNQADDNETSSCVPSFSLNCKESKFVDLTKPTEFSASKSFKCEGCGETFSSKNIYDNHLQTHAGARPFENNCENSDTTKDCLVDHQDVHANQRFFKCDLCEKEFMSKCGLESHRERRCPFRSYPSSGERTETVLSNNTETSCEDLNENQPVELLYHYDKQSNELSIGDQQLAQKDSVILSAEKVNPGKSQDSQSILRCKKCQKVCKGDSLLQAHQKFCRGAKSYKCKRCDMCFNQLCDFLSHQQNHVIKK